MAAVKVDVMDEGATIDYLIMVPPPSTENHMYGDRPPTTNDTPVKCQTPDLSHDQVLIIIKLTCKCANFNNF